MSIIGKIVAHRVASILEDSVLMQGTIVSGYQSKRAFGWTVQAILLLMIFFVGCAHRSDWAARIEWDTLEFGALPGKEEFPEDEAIIILDEGKMEIFDGSESDLSVFEQHRIVKVLDSRGRKYVNIAIPYSPTSRVVRIQARTISPEGRITSLDTEDIHDITFYPNFVFYSDKRAKLFTFPAVEDGSLIEYRYRLNINALTFWHSWRFQDDVPTLFSRFTLVESAAYDVHYRLYHIDLSPTIDQKPAGFKTTYIWEARDVPARKTEYGMPAGGESLARLALAPVGVETWDDVTQWFFELSEPRIQGGTGVKSLADSLVRGLEDDEKKLRRIYEWVRDRIRYIAVTIGIGGYQPHPAEDILVQRYGDCKDMTTLLCSLGREVGLDVRMVLIGTRQTARPDTTLPSQLQFDHAIAVFASPGGADVWMDATAKGCPFGQLPWYDQGVPVLVVGQEGAAVWKETPKQITDSSRVIFDWDVSLEPSGAAEVTGKTVLTGCQASNLRDDLLSASNRTRQQWLETFLADRCSGIELNSFRLSGCEPVSDPLVIHHSFRTSTFGLRRNGQIILRPGTIQQFELPDHLRSTERIHPIRFMFASRSTVRLDISLSPGWSIEPMAHSDSLQSDFGEAFWSWDGEGNRLNVHLDHSSSGEEIQPSDYDVYRSYIDGIRLRNSYEIVLPQPSGVKTGRIN